MSVKTNVNDRLADLARDVKHIEGERAAGLAAIDKQLKNFRQQAFTEKSQKALREKRERAEEAYDAILAPMYVELDLLSKVLEAETAQALEKQENAGAEERAVLKERMRGAYLAAGGSPSDFEGKWPELLQAELARRVLSEMGAPRAAGYRPKL